MCRVIVVVLEKENQQHQVLNSPSIRYHFSHIRGMSQSPNKSAVNRELGIAIDVSNHLATAELQDQHGNSDPNSKKFTPLEELNAAASSSIYTPLNKDEIRLVLLFPHGGIEDTPIQCTVLNFESSEAPPYSALSYVCK